MESLARISASRKTGAEPLTAAGEPVGATVGEILTLEQVRPPR